MRHASLRTLATVLFMCCCSAEEDCLRDGVNLDDCYQYFYLNGSAVTVQYNSSSYVDVSCDDGVELSQLPAIGGLRGARVPLVRVEQCGVSAQLLPAHLTAAAVTQLRLVHTSPPGPQPAHLAQLHALTTLELKLASPDGASAQLLDSIADLPKLEKLTLWGAPPPRRCAPSLTQLEVSDVPGGLRLDGGRFVGCPRLRRLLIYNAGLSELHKDALAGLPHLRLLDLSNNQLRDLPAAALMLTNLSLSANPLRRLTADAMKLPKLQELLLENMRVNVQLEGALSAMPSLRTLAISGEVHSLAGGQLTQSTDLRMLSVTRTRVSHVPDDMLETQTELRMLDLSNNAIERVSRRLFANLAKLETLNLDGNRILEFESNMCAGMRALVTASARHNGLRHIGVDAFTAAAAHLRHLHLTNNSLHHTTPYNQLLQLETLHLDHNHYQTIAYDWRIILLKLNTLDLSYNNISMITLDDLEFINDGVTVDLRHNNISGIYVNNLGQYGQYEEDTAPPQHTLLLTDNPYVCDCSIYQLLRFIEHHRRHPVAAALAAVHCTAPHIYEGRPLSGLTSEGLSCSLGAPECPSQCECTLRPSAPPALALCPFAALPALPVADLSVRLRAPTPARVTLPPLMGTPTALSFANVGLLTFATVHHLPESLREVDLSGNSLSSIDEVTLNLLLSGGRRVRLKGNPWWCGCGAGRFVRALGAARGRVADWNETECAGGAPMAEATGSCVGVVSAVVCGVGAVVLAMVVSVAWWMRRMRRMRDRCEKEAMEEAAAGAHCRFDVFVSHAHEDARWVWEHLQPSLEGAGLRLCVHSRDWQVGEAIPAQIERSVTESRRTLLLLSKHFLNSAWALLEFRTALSACGTRPRLLAVLLEPAGALLPLTPPDLREWLSTTTYLPRSDPAFWPKLHAALPRPLPQVPPLLPAKTPS